ncbi:iron-sulfur transferase [Aureococcus anophagefferens]|nr:iron-sulfur transferase [Aureococcus anophagefferens]
MADRYAVLQKLGDGQNAMLGVAAGGIEAAATQPLTYAKNCFQQRTPLSLVPRVVYRGTPASMAADGTLIGTQFACCGFLQKRVLGGEARPLTAAEELGTAWLAGYASGVPCCVMELIMIQQQKNGGMRAPANQWRSVDGTAFRAARDYGGCCERFGGSTKDRETTISARTGAGTALYWSQALDSWCSPTKFFAQVLAAPPSGRLSRPRTRRRAMLSLRRVAAIAARRPGSRGAARADHQEVIDHFEKPLNVGSMDKNDPSVGTGLVGAPACGDVMKLQIKIDDDGNIAIASSSVAASGSGHNASTAAVITNWEIAALNLPRQLHCSMLAEDAINAAIADYKSRRSCAAWGGSLVVSRDHPRAFASMMVAP